jgi:hypothetical protein
MIGCLDEVIGSPGLPTDAFGSYLFRFWKRERPVSETKGVGWEKRKSNQAGKLAIEG